MPVLRVHDERAVAQRRVDELIRGAYDAISALYCEAPRGIGEVVLHVDDEERDVPIEGQIAHCAPPVTEVTRSPGTPMATYMLVSLSSRPMENGFPFASGYRVPWVGNDTPVVRVEGPDMSDSVGLYLNEIGLVPLLTAMEERELSQVIERGREAATRLEAGEKSRELRQAVKAAAAAKDRFIRANLRLVVSIARRYPMPPGMELLDLIQEGNLGLEHAVDKFDWRKGFKFSTYATFWIRQAIGRALDQKASLVRLPGDRSASLRAALRAVAATATSSMTSTPPPSA